MNRKIFSWGLYDFANSIIIANLTLYFSQWIVIDNQIDDFWYGLTLSLSTVFLIITAPFFGALSDRTQKRMRYIIPISIGMTVGTVLLGIIGASSLSVLTRIVITLVLALLVQYLFQLSLVFYDTLLPSLTSRIHFGKISGFGEGMGNLGFLVGIFLTLPLVNGKITLLGTSGRIQAFIPAGIAFLLLSIPMFFFVRDSDQSKGTMQKINYRDVVQNIKNMLRNKNIFWFLLSFHFISDAVLTIQSFFPIYFQQVFGLTDTQKVILTSLALVCIVLGAFVLGKMSDRLGKKTVLLVCTVLLSIFFILMALVKESLYVWILMPLLGICWGGFYAISRALITQLSPREKLGEYFSLYTIFRRSASVVGPLLWGISIWAFSSYGVAKYRFSMYPLVALMLIGIVLLSKVSEPDESSALPQ